METIYVEGIHQQDEEGRRVLFGKVSKEPNPEQEQDPSQFALSLSSLRRDRISVHSFSLSKNEVILAKMEAEFRGEREAREFVMQEIRSAIKTKDEEPTCWITCFPSAGNPWSPSDFVAQLA